VASARQIRRLLADLNADGTTIFLTTHHIEEAERLCGRIAFIVDGRIVRTDDVGALMQLAEGRHGVRFAVAGDAAAMCPRIKASFPELECTAFGTDAIRIDSRSPIPVGPLVRLLEDQGTEVYEARRIRPSLEDVFVAVTGVTVDQMKRDKEQKLSKLNGGSAG
jgi:ABC-2 type transport system ATP-binding protein